LKLNSLFGIKLNRLGVAMFGKEWHNIAF